MVTMYLLNNPGAVRAGLRPCPSWLGQIDHAFGFCACGVRWNRIALLEAPPSRRLYRVLVTFVESEFRLIAKRAKHEPDHS